MPALSRPEVPGRLHDTAAGTQKCYSAGCGMPECRKANTRHHKRYTIARAHGEDTSRDASTERAIAHLRWIMAETNLKIPSIAPHLDVTMTTLYAMMSGRLTHIRKRTERRILALRPEQITPIARAYVDATVTHRQLTALYALGYNWRWLSEQLGYATRLGARKFMDVDTVTAAGAAKVAALAKRVGDKPGPSEAARRHAKTVGWKVPAEYDDGWQLPDPKDYAHLGRFSATAERQEVRRDIVRTWTLGARTAREIAEHLLVMELATGTADNVMRQVQRDRAVLGLRAEDLQDAA